jgi:hypothetical protein
LIFFASVELIFFWNIIAEEDCESQKYGIVIIVMKSLAECLICPMVLSRPELGYGQNFIKSLEPTLKYAQMCVNHF